MARTLCVILLVATLWLSGCAGGGATPASQASGAALPTAPAGDVGAVAGQVVDEEMMPVRGVDVALARTEHPATTTDAEGRFRFDGVPPGTHAVLAQALGYETATKSVNVAAGEVTEVTITLQAITISVARQTTFSGDGYIDLAFNVYDQQIWPLVVNVTTFRRNWFTFEVDADAVSVVTHVEWTPASGAGVKYLEHTAYVRHKGTLAATLNYTKGPSPLSIRDDELATHGGGKKFQLNPGFRFMPCDTNCPPDAMVQVGIEQRVSLYAQVFFVDPAPPEYKFAKS